MLKGFLELWEREKKKILLAGFLLLVILAAVYWRFLRQVETGNAQLLKTAIQIEIPDQGEQKEKKILLTYQSPALRDPFKPLLDFAQTPEENNLPDNPLPENNFLPEDLPVPPENNSSKPTEEKTVVQGIAEQTVVQGIMEEKGRFFALLAKGEQSRIVKAGDHSEEFGTVLSIDRNQVVLEKGAEKIILEIGKD